jgi:hypothetical protein
VGHPPGRGDDRATRHRGVCGEWAARHDISEHVIFALSLPEEGVMGTDEYLQILGRIVFTYLGLQYGITSLGNKLAPGLISVGDIRSLGSVAHDFTILTFVGNAPELKEIASRFADVTKTFNGLLETTPFSDFDNEQCLGSSELNTKWKLPVLQSFSETVTGLQTDVDNLLNASQDSNTV